jgi:hypothetical protein
VSCLPICVQKLLAQKKADFGRNPPKKAILQNLNQLIREIRSRMPLLHYSNEHLIEEFHAFEAMLAHLTQERAMKFFFDLTKEKGNSAPSVPGFLSHLVCEEAQTSDDRTASNALFGLFNIMIETSQKENPFDAVLDDFIDRVRLRN